MPTRLLCLDNNGSAHLCISADLANDVPYAAISHCWGTHPFLTLKKSNFKDFQDRIPGKALTKTFRDAIDIAKFLGIQYLWLDSLCIIQDDSEDWQKEAALMGSVYGGSVVTIAASSAPDGNGGCFFDRRFSWRCEIELGIPNKRQLYEVIPSMLTDSASKTPLSSRGWVTQERILSPRILYFTDIEVLWECDQCIASETFPDILHEDPNWPVASSKLPENLIDWSEIVRQYTRRYFTYSSDKLVAISSIAEKFQSKVKGDYLAGMWMQDLEKQLCWFLTSSRERISPYVAPSVSFSKFLSENKGERRDFLEILRHKLHFISRSF